MNQKKIAKLSIKPPDNETKFFILKHHKIRNVSFFWGEFNVSTKKLHEDFLISRYATAVNYLHRVILRKKSNTQCRDANKF